MKKGRSLVCLLTGMMLIVPTLLSAQETTDTLKKEREVKISLHLLAQGEYRDGGLFSGDELKDIDLRGMGKSIDKERFFRPNRPSDISL